MKRLMLLGLASCLVLFVQAQRVYFIYLQTEDATPFFIKMDNKVYSSSYSGYLILSNLKDSIYNFSVGPVAKGVKEPQFAITINGGDKGYLIKSFQEYTGLFDLQSLNIVKPVNGESKSNSGSSLVPRTDAFTVMLALSSGDSSLLYSQSIAKAEATGETEKKKEIKAEVKDTFAAVVAVNPVSTSTETPKTENEVTALKLDKKAVDTVAVAPQQEVVKAVDSMAQKPAAIEEYKKSTIVRRSESSTTEGFGLVFIDMRGEAADTIRLLIPNQKIVFVSTPPAEHLETKPAADTVAKVTDSMVKRTAVAPVEKKEEKTEPPAIAELPKEKVDSSAMVPNKVDSLIETKIKVAEKPVQNLACKAMASDNDFFKLRKNMASRDADDDMITEAKKMFKSRCYTTEQIRNLSALFLTPSGKYEFFDAAYTHVSDPQNFASLQSEIKDDYNLKRFRALIGE